MLQLNRLWKPALLSAAVIAACILLFDTNSIRLPLLPSDRPFKFPFSWDDIPTSFWICSAITAVNFAVYVAWRVPRFWWLMNRYFVVVAGYPSAISMVSVLFSHQYWKTHLATNTIFLYTIGMTRKSTCFRCNYSAP
jgi:rhomboid-like protein